MPEFPIVGIGSSAGGLEALQKLFGATAPDAGLAFIVAAHLDPTQKSHLSELLSRCTKMPVVQIEKPIKVEPDHVYVIAPDQELTIRKGVVHTNKPTAPRGHRHPVDYFFRSLAEDQGERAIAIILSGTGTNGSTSPSANARRRSFRGPRSLRKGSSTVCPWRSWCLRPRSRCRPRTIPSASFSRSTGRM